MKKIMAVRFAGGGALRISLTAIALISLLFAVQSSNALAAKRSLRLVMFEQSGCHYCETWDREVGRSYHLTDEGKFAPLERRNIHDKMAGGIKPVVYTPTFVLIKNGREIGRLTGYISEDFFWSALGALLQQQGFGAL